ncbi:hypothetical protein NE237_024645 [Protea cynaroides]|uniref:Uncharacterized protein n=1 Tax=Protea cynaroides TaxID=273540 RepID=A0A9Q0H5J7_9MAGN|nr:hypothetical protein NE237_024645 [Protea cynaroides]
MVFTTGRVLKELMAFGGMISMVNKSSGQVEGVIPVSQRRSTIPSWSQEAVVLSTDGSRSVDGALQVVLESATVVVSVAKCWVLLESHPGHGRLTTGSAGGLADPPTRVLQIELGTRESGKKGTQCSASSGGCISTFGSCRCLGRLFTYCAIVAVECESISDSVIAYDEFVCGTWEEQKAFGTSFMRGVLDGEKNPRLQAATVVLGKWISMIKWVVADEGEDVQQSVVICSSVVMVMVGSLGSVGSSSDEMKFQQAWWLRVNGVAEMMRVAE